MAKHANKRVILIDMDIKQNVSLRDYSTMRLGGTAQNMVEVNNKDELAEAVEWAAKLNLPTVIIGEGSNIIWSDNGFKGLVIINKILGFEKLAEDESSSTYKIGAGEDWDLTVNRLVEENLSGVECLSLIPGKAGATPVQNVGAYGQEISQTLQSLEAYDSQSKSFVTITNQDCGFDYRNSRFKSSDKGRFFIVSITLRLTKIAPNPPFYANLQAYLDEHNIHEYSPQIIRDAVIAIRSEKMPDWHKIANNGSFFANPIVSPEKYAELKAKYSGIVAWPQENGYKLSAGWLLEAAGLRGYHDPETGMATSDKTALVFINENAKDTADLLKFKQKVTEKVKAMFGIELAQEPELIS